MTCYSIESKTRTYVKGYGFLLIARKYEKKILDKGLDDSKRVAIKQVNLYKIKLQMQ